MVALIVIALLAAWAFAPRMLRGRADPRARQAAAWLASSGRYLGAAVLALLVAGMTLALLLRFGE